MQRKEIKVQESVNTVKIYCSAYLTLQYGEISSQ